MRPRILSARGAAKGVALLGLVTGLFVLPTPAFAWECPGEGLIRNVSDTYPKVDICHRTGSASNPYVLITVNYHAALAAHCDHRQTGNGPDHDIFPDDFFTRFSCPV